MSFKRLGHSEGTHTVIFNRKLNPVNIILEKRLLLSTLDKRGVDIARGMRNTFLNEVLHMWLLNKQCEKMKVNGKV